MNWIDILNSNFILALVTTIVAFTAWLVYSAEKRDRYRNTAEIVLLEIQNAERNLRKVKTFVHNFNKQPSSIYEDTSLEDVKIMPNDNWSRNKYLFLDTLEENEWDVIDSFYIKCHAIDNLLNAFKSAFWEDAEQIRQNRHRISAEIALEVAKAINFPEYSDAYVEEEELRKAKIINDRFDYTYERLVMPYKPDRIIQDLRIYIEQVNDNLSISNIYTKLNNAKHAKIRRFMSLKY